MTAEATADEHETTEQQIAALLRDILATQKEILKVCVLLANPQMLFDPEISSAKGGLDAYDKPGAAYYVDEYGRRL